jgi:N-acetylglucosaminyldiphosphoundecaprenol N-acetyl-beta-D-mannosaminyltransferase
MNCKSQRVDILGVAVSAINMGDAIAVIEQWIDQRTPHYVCVRDVHGVMASRKDSRLRDIHNQAGLVTPDGMPLVWLARRLGAARTRRVCGSDLMHAMTALSAIRGYRQFFYGGGEGVANKLKSALIRRHPKLQVVGTMCPPFRMLTPQEDEAAVAAINAASPDIVWVGLSTPKQEYWMAEHRSRIKAPVLIGVGAAFDFLSGSTKRAPLWMQRSGLEWLFRLLTEPRRLWRRYATIVPAFIFLSMRQLITAKWLRPRGRPAPTNYQPLSFEECERTE